MHAAWQDPLEPAAPLSRSREREQANPQAMPIINPQSSISRTLSQHRLRQCSFTKNLHLSILNPNNRAGYPAC